jgi:hypothetical protein
VTNSLTSNYLVSSEGTLATSSSGVLDRHLENETRLTFETRELGKQLKSCQKDLFDINEFLLNELKVPSP